MPPFRNSIYGSAPGVADDYNLDNEDRIYVDLNFRSPANRSRAEFVFNTTDYFIHHDISRYGLSVIRFNLQHARLPIFIWRENEELDYFVTLFNNAGESSTKRLTFDPDHDFTDERQFYIYSVDQVLKMLNVALKEAWDELKSLDPSTLGDHAPVFYYDVNTNKINYIVDYTMREAQTGNKVIMYFSTILSKYFRHLRYTEPIDDPIDLNLIGMKFIPREEPLNSNRIDESLQYAANGEYLHLTSLYQNSRYFSPIQTIKLSANLNNRNEIKVVSDEIDVSQENYLTDFAADIENPIEIAQSELYYLNDTEKRFIDLMSSSNLSSISIRFIWTDVLGRDHVVHMEENQTFNVKLLFRKKTVKNIS